MVCKIDTEDVSTHGWQYQSVSGLIDINGAKDEVFGTDGTTSTNELFGKRYKKARSVALSFVGAFDSISSFESGVMWIIGLLIQPDFHSFDIGDEYITGTMVGGLTVKQGRDANVDLTIGSADFGNQKVIGQVTVNIQRYG